MNWFKFAQAVQPQAQSVSQYTIQSGDTLGQIAKKLLGNEGRWTEIQRLNPGINPKRLQIGQVINVPASSPTAAVQTQAPAQTTNNQQPNSNAAAEYKLSNIKTTIMSSEGFRSKSYFDPPNQRVNKAIGYGFNITSRRDSSQLLKNLGLDPKKVIQGTQEINQQQAEYLLDEAIKVAMADAKYAAPNFESYPETVKSILIDMAYNMGGERLSKFKLMISALNNKDYKKAAKEMVDSDWYNQVGERSKRLVSIMSNVR
jgi:LysM repeat protein